MHGHAVHFYIALLRMLNSKSCKILSWVNAENMLFPTSFRNIYVRRHYQPRVVPPVVDKRLQVVTSHSYSVIVSKLFR